MNEHVAHVQDNTHATRAHLLRLGVSPNAGPDGTLTIATSSFGMVLRRLLFDCRQPSHHIAAYLHALYMNEFPPTSISDEITSCIGVAGAQQLERTFRFSLGEIRLCVVPGCDEWALMSFLIEFLSQSMGVQASARD